jgi:PilZ domain
MDKNDTPNTRSPTISNGPVRPQHSLQHQLLLDRLTKRPVPVVPQAAVGEPLQDGQRHAETRQRSPEPREPAIQPQIEERRAAPRRRMLKGGVMAFNGSFSGMQCTVRDLSDTGARLKVNSVANFPETFELIIEIDGLYAKSTVVWRKGSDVGVRFMEPVRTGAKIREQVITRRT